MASTMLCLVLPVEAVSGTEVPMALAMLGTEALIVGEEEEFVFLDRPAHRAAELLQLRRENRAGRRG